MIVMSTSDAVSLQGGRKTCRELRFGAWGAGLDFNFRRQARFERKADRRGCPKYQYPFRKPTK